VHDHDVHFHQLERSTGSRIGNQRVSKETGEPVEADDIELGYEISKGRYVTFERDEIDELRPRSTRSVEVSDFVDLGDIDPVYYERTYWLVPSDEAAEQAYRLLATAMEDSQRVGIGSVVMRNKQYLAAIRPLQGALAMSTMRFADEVVEIGDVDGVPSTKQKPSQKELALANQIIDSLATDWDPGRYQDTYTDELIKLIEAKDRGDEVVVEDEEPDTGAEVIDLMAALEASVADARSGAKRSGSSRSSSGTKQQKAPARTSAPAKKSTSKKPTSRKPAGTSAKKSAGKKAAEKKSPAKRTPAKRSSKAAPARKSA
jgi:DNA end-binding protein Ku